MIIFGTHSVLKAICIKDLLIVTLDMSFAIAISDLIAEAIKNFVDDKDAKKIEKND